MVRRQRRRRLASRDRRIRRHSRPQRACSILPRTRGPARAASRFPLRRGRAAALRSIGLAVSPASRPGPRSASRTGRRRNGSHPPGSAATCRPNMGRRTGIALAHSWLEDGSQRLILHFMPNLSVSIPNRGDQKVLSNGIVTAPPADSLEKISSTWDLLSVSIPSTKLSPDVPPRSGGASVEDEVWIELHSRHSFHLKS